MTDKKEVWGLFKLHGGSKHGPNVETCTIPEKGFWDFVEAYEKLIQSRAEWDQVNDEMGGEYATGQLGRRP